MKRTKLFATALVLLALIFCMICFASCDGKSVSVNSITASPSSVTLHVGETATVIVEFNPQNATNTSLIWTSSDTDIATVSNGVVTAVALGNAVVTAESVDGHFVSTCKVKVTDKYDVEGVSLSQSTAQIDIGGSLTLTATVFPSNATNKAVEWTSSNESVATVSNGVVTAIAQGETIITVKSVDDQTKYSICVVTVNFVHANSVSLSETASNINIGDSVTLVPTISPSNSTNKNVTWASSNESVAVVTNGTVIGLSAGETDITVTTQDGSKVATCHVTVHFVNIESISFANSTLDLSTDEVVKLVPTITPSNASNKKVTWTSSDESVVTVDTYGNVTGIGEGSAVITATTEQGSHQATVSVSVHNCIVKVVDMGGNPVVGGTLEILLRTGGSRFMTSNSNGIFEDGGGSNIVSVRETNADKAIFSYELTEGASVAYYYTGDFITLNKASATDYVYTLQVRKYNLPSGNWIASDNENDPAILDTVGTYATKIYAVPDPLAAGQMKPSTTAVTIKAPSNVGKHYVLTLHSDYNYESDGVFDGYRFRSCMSTVNKYLLTEPLNTQTLDLYLHAGESMNVEISIRALDKHETSPGVIEYDPYCFAFELREDTLPDEGTTPLYPYIAKLGKSENARYTNIGANKNANGETYFVLDVSGESTIQKAASGKVKITYESGTMTWKINIGAEGGYSDYVSGGIEELYGSNFALFCISGADGDSTFTIERFYELGDLEMPYTLTVEGTSADIWVSGISSQSEVYKYVKVTAASEQRTYNITISGEDYFAIVYYNGEEIVVAKTDTQSSGTMTIGADVTWYIRVNGDVAYARVIVTVSE